MAGASFKEFESAAWEAKAARYDSTWGQVSSQAIEQILDLARIRPKQKVLDCGCGPGHLCAAAAARGAVVTGCDLSPRMLEIARNFHPGVEFHRQDAESLTLPAGTFDAVTMNFLLLHVEDQKRCLLEGKRMLKAGGVLAFSIWLPPSVSPGLELMFGAVREYADPSVIPPAQDIFMFADRGAAAKFLTANGFEPPAFVQAETAWRVRSGEEFFTAVQAGTRIGGMIDLQRPEIKEKIKARMIDGMERFKTDDGYTLPTPALLAAARRVG